MVDFENPAPEGMGFIWPFFGLLAFVVLWFTFPIWMPAGYILNVVAAAWLKIPIYNGSNTEVMCCFYLADLLVCFFYFLLFQAGLWIWRRFGRRTPQERGSP